ncbi:MAG: hypothetical protein EA359_01115 [Balneolaceae bacterium]|nr:MAG: hypothetical protein EA359_01115 [Balneolaceae bacterium]
MKILIDMNLTPDWVHVFQENGYSAVHWTEKGIANATDQTIMKFAREHGYVVFTHDLDFGNILAASGEKKPSVIQIRTENTAPEVMKDVLLKALKQFENHLLEGALITLHPNRMKAKILPLDR